MKTIKWHKGIANLVSKKDYDDVIKDVTNRGYYEANRNDFSLFCRRSERHSNWRDVVATTLPRKADTIIESIVCNYINYLVFLFVFF